MIKTFHKSSILRTQYGRSCLLFCILLLCTPRENCAASEIGTLSDVVENSQMMLGIGYSTLNHADMEIGSILSAESDEVITGPAILGGLGIDGWKLMIGFSRGDSRIISYSALIGKHKPWNGDKTKNLVGFRLGGFIRAAYYYALEDSHQFEIGVGF